MDLVDEIEGAGNRILLSKWNNKSNLNVQTIARILPRANNTQLYIHGPYKNQWTQWNNPIFNNYIWLCLSIANTVNFESLQTKLNARLPEIQDNRVNHAYSDCVDPGMVGLLLRSHWKDMCTSDLQAVYSIGSYLWSSHERIPLEEKRKSTTINQGQYQSGTSHSHQVQKERHPQSNHLLQKLLPKKSNRKNDKRQQPDSRH